MPESRKRKKVIEQRARQAQHRTEHPRTESVETLRSPKWYAPLMVTLAILGLIVLVAAYVTGGNAPIPGLGNWNLAIGLVLMIAGFLMTMGWK